MHQILKYPNFIDLKKKVYDLEINVNSIIGFLKCRDINCKKKQHKNIFSNRK